MVAASLLADDGRASHHGIYPRRFPHAPALPGASPDTAAAAHHRLNAGVRFPPAGAPTGMVGAPEPSIHAQPRRANAEAA
jgi:hypothetical protein